MTTEVIIVRARQTCEACPSQWDAWDADGNYWYLRFRHEIGTAERQRSNQPGDWVMKHPELYFERRDAHLPSGYITLEEFCERAGLNLALKPV